MRQRIIGSSTQLPNPISMVERFSFFLSEYQILCVILISICLFNFDEVESL